MASEALAGGHEGRTPASALARKVDRAVLPGELVASAGDPATKLRFSIAPGPAGLLAGPGSTPGGTSNWCGTAGGRSRGAHGVLIRRILRELFGAGSDLGRRRGQARTFLADIPSPRAG